MARQRASDLAMFRDIRQKIMGSAANFQQMRENLKLEAKKLKEIRDKIGGEMGEEGGALK